MKKACPYRPFVMKALPIIGLVAGISVVIYLLSLLRQGSTFFKFWGEASRIPEADAANGLIRSTANFNWTFIAIFALVFILIWCPLVI